MTAEHTEDERGGDVVPIRPVPEPPPGHDPLDAPVAGDGAPGTDVAVPDPAAGAEPYTGPRVIYASVTQIGERRPVIPVSLQRENIRGTVEHLIGLNWHRARYHGLRLPVYVLAHLAWAIVGLVRVAGRLIRWWWLTEQHWLRSDTAAEGDSHEWMKLHKEAKATRKTRGLILLGALAGVAIAAALLIRFGTWWAWALVLAVAAVALARAGSPAGHQIVARAVVPPDYSPPTHEIISRALGSLNIAQINAALKPDKDSKATGIRFISDVYRDGPGWACQLDLPHGVSVSTILGRREDFASGLRRPCRRPGPRASRRSTPAEWTCGWASTTSPRPGRHRARWSRPAARTCSA